MGRAWTREYHLTESPGPARLVGFAYRVEALEEVTVPAGRFIAFRVRRQDAFESIVRWWSPELGLPIKTQRERSRVHRLGPGTLLEELVAWEFSPGSDP